MAHFLICFRSRLGIAYLRRSTAVLAALAYGCNLDQAEQRADYFSDHVSVSRSTACTSSPTSKGMFRYFSWITPGCRPTHGVCFSFRKEHLSPCTCFSAHDLVSVSLEVFAATALPDSWHNQSFFRRRLLDCLCNKSLVYKGARQSTR